MAPFNVSPILLLYSSAALSAAAAAAGRRLPCASPPTTTTVRGNITNNMERPSLTPSCACGIITVLLTVLLSVTTTLFVIYPCTLGRAKKHAVRHLQPRLTTQILTSTVSSPASGQPAAANPDSTSAAVQQRAQQCRYTRMTRPLARCTVRAD